MDTYSDSESVYSLDSLEDKSNDKSKTCVTSNPTVKNVIKSSNATVPYYRGEISVENLKLSSKSRNTSSRSLNSQEVKHSSIPKERAKKNIYDQATSYFWNDAPSKQQVCGQRMSRRKEFITQNKNSLRARHRSVSYAEQFRKRTFGTNNLDASNYSITSSKLPDRNKNLSFISCLSVESRMSVTESDFYNDLMKSPTIEQSLWDKESLQSSTLISEKGVKSAKSNKSTTQFKKKPIVLSRVEVTLPEHQKGELDKKRSIEKREIYANKVKVRNQIKINRQKERDKNEKFQSPSVHLNTSTEDCFLQPEIKHVCCNMSDIKTSVPHPPSASTHQRNSNSGRKMPINERIQKSKRESQQKHIKKNKKISELISLQERHEREKSLIESMRNLILKT